MLRSSRLRAMSLTAALASVSVAGCTEGRPPHDCDYDGSASDPACATCTLTYRFSNPAPTGSRLRIQPAGNATTVDIGPGTMTVRVPSDANGMPRAGKVDLLYFDLDIVFGPVNGVTTETRVCLLA